jgi:hypothetical protein
VTLAESREQVARAVGLPLRRQFFVVAEDRVRAAGLGSLAKSVTRSLAAPRDLRASLVSWINFIFLPEAVNRCPTPPREARAPLAPPAHPGV